MRVLPIVLLGLAIGAGEGMAQSGVVPMRLVEGRPVVDVTIEGAGPFPFVMDTGAGATVLNRDLVDELGLDAGGLVRLGDPSGGEGMPGTMHTLPTIAVGEWQFHDVFAVSWQDPTIGEALGGPRGVLGAASLQGVTLTFDFPAMELRIGREGLEEGDGSVAFSAPQGPIPSLLLHVAGTELEAHVDTGNGRGLGLPGSVRPSLTFMGETTATTARTASGEFPIEVGRIADTVRFADVALDQPTIFLSDRYPTANIGTPALLDLVLTVDVARRRLRIERPR